MKFHWIRPASVTILGLVGVGLSSPDPSFVFATEFLTPKEPAMHGVASAPPGLAISSEKEIDASFKDIDIATVLRLIARDVEGSVIIDGEIKGTISIEFNRVPVIEALQSIADIGQLHMAKKGRVIVVQPRAKHQVTKGFRLENIHVSNLAETMGSLFGDRATIEVDPNTNSLLAFAPSNVIDEMSALLSRLDVSQRQVMIEAAIVQVDLDDDSKLGVNLAAVLNQSDLTATIQDLGFASIPITLGDPEGLFAEGNFFVGKTDKSVDVLLEALQTVMDTKVLSHPKVLGVSGQEAEIIVGQKLGFRVVTTTQTSTQESIQFLEVGTQLKFTPNITENGDVVIDIHPEVSDGSISEDGLPNENTTEITTRVRVPNGMTMVLGGLIRERQQKIVKRVPFLGRIPILGFLFRRTVESIGRSEILVFMTPRVLSAREDGSTSLKEIERIRRLYEEGLDQDTPGSDGFFSPPRSQGSSPPMIP